MADFLGIRYAELEDIPSGINVVPLTITGMAGEEESALVAGVTGYTLTEEEITDPDGKPDSSRPSLHESSLSAGKLESSRSADTPAASSLAAVYELSESDDTHLVWFGAKQLIRNRVKVESG